MRMKNYGRGVCGCCSGNTRPVYGSPRDVTGRRYCAPCWNTLGAAPTAEVPWADDADDATRSRRIGRGWKVLAG